MSFPHPDNMPALNLNTPSQLGRTSSVELNEGLLRHWIKRLPNNDLESFTKLYLEALQRFNQNDTNEQQRLLLLDLYREPLNSLLFSLTPSRLAKDLPDLSRRNKFINVFSEVMAELATGYKIIIIQAEQKDANLTPLSIALLAVNRACEQLSYMALHAYKFYRAVPARLFNELHQLYQLTLAAGVEKSTAFVNKQLQSESSFKDRYSQLLLISISNPYGLASGEILNAYKIMGRLAAAADITPLPMGAKATPGHFYINCLSDRIPTPSVLPMLANQAQPPALVLNTKPVLIAVDAFFQKLTDVQDPSVAANINLLKQLIPFLNTSYERKQARIPVTGNKYAYLAVGLTTVHQCLTDASILAEDIAKPNSSWEILNKNGTGYLVSQYNVIDHRDVSVEGLVGVFELDSKGEKALIRIAVIRWIRTDHDGRTKIGLDVIEGEPSAVQYSTDNTDKLLPAIFIPEISRINRPASLITVTGVFSPNRIVQIKPKKKKHFQFNIKLGKLIESNASFERFTFSEDVAE
ncbi:MAG: hypothetical protein OEY48_07530 [Gammaproteobacteria bacterium]|nr:hypothetical protein [Gammaproteobacteria bacterium]MDH5592683.1 hypothetical protein [Gammaproteobacteria bacterium]